MPFQLRAPAMIPAAILALTGATGTFGGELFSDDFDTGAAPEWGNEIGAWIAESGAYRATLPTNNPPTVSSLPFQVRNLTIDVDVNDIQDGGIWLRATFDDVTGEIENGVLLVTGGDLGTYSGFYWHTIEDGAASGYLALSGPGLFEPGVSDVSLHVRVNGDTYEVFLDGNPEPATTLVTNLFCDGQVGLYDFSDQTFDNFVLSDLPPTPDIDGDGSVGFADLLVVLSAWGPCAECCPGDVNGDLQVDFGDLLEVLSVWGPV